MDRARILPYLSIFEKKLPKEDFKLLEDTTSAILNEVLVVMGDETDFTTKRISILKGHMESNSCLPSYPWKNRSYHPVKPGGTAFESKIVKRNSDDSDSDIFVEKEKKGTTNSSQSS